MLKNLKYYDYGQRHIDIHNGAKISSTQKNKYIGKQRQLGDLQPGMKFRGKISTFHRDVAKSFTKKQRLTKTYLVRRSLDKQYE